MQVRNRGGSANEQESQNTVAIKISTHVDIDFARLITASLLYGLAGYRS